MRFGANFAVASVLFAILAAAEISAQQPVPIQDLPTAIRTIEETLPIPANSQNK